MAATASWFETPEARLERAGCFAGLDVSLRAALGFQGPIYSVPHHVSHAAWGYFLSSFDEAACLIADGVGEWASTTLARATKAVPDALWAR
jgi:predicted NodU family carbamoyl transferase